MKNFPDFFRNRLNLRHHFPFCLLSLLFLCSCLVGEGLANETKGDLSTPMQPENLKPTIHYRPQVGRLADTIPFYWKGEYHIFYLRGNIGKVPWEHIVSTDLVHWNLLPTALVSDGEENGPDGEHMFTGSVIEHQGTFHIFYTGWNPRNQTGREWIMHATSSDLVKWTKHPEHGFRADGEHYQNTDFRDPYVFWSDAEKCFWMVLCARDGKTAQPVQGVAKSTDLITWAQSTPLTMAPPLGEGTPECPDVFKIGSSCYLLHSPSAGTTDMRWSENLQGPYFPPPSPNIDTPILYAAKRMFDGKRHILTGWLRDLGGDKDGGDFQWGGHQSVPREVSAGPKGQLLFRPVPEALALYKTTVSSLSQASIGKAGATSPASCSFAPPPNYLLECSLEFNPQDQFTIHFRAQKTSEEAYRLILSPSINEASIEGKTFKYPRQVSFEPGKPIKIQAFVEDSLIECFINEGYAFSCRAYDLKEGGLTLQVSQGIAQIPNLSIKIQGK